MAVPALLPSVCKDPPPDVSVPDVSVYLSNDARLLPLRVQLTAVTTNDHCTFRYRNGQEIESTADSLPGAFSAASLS